MKILTLLLLLSSVSYAQLTAPADTIVSISLNEARGVVRGIQLLEADTAKKSEIIRAQDHLIGSMNRELAIAEQQQRIQRRIGAEQAEQIRLLKSNIEYYKQALKDSEPTIFEQWWLQIPIGAALGIFVAYRILK